MKVNAENFSYVHIVAPDFKAGSEFKGMARLK
jgi:hypothetical protein